MDPYLTESLWTCEWTFTWERIFEYVNRPLPKRGSLNMWMDLFPTQKTNPYSVLLRDKYHRVLLTPLPPPFLNRALRNNAHCVHWQRLTNVQRLANVHWKRLTNVHWQRFTNMHWQSLHNDSDFAHWQRPTIARWQRLCIMTETLHINIKGLYWTLALHTYHSQWVICIKSELQRKAFSSESAFLVIGLEGFCAFVYTELYVVHISVSVCILFQTCHSWQGDTGWRYSSLVNVW